MNSDVQQRLRDAFSAATLIWRQFSDLSQDDFLADPWFRSATKRQLEIIGEALNQARRLAPDLSDQFSTIHEWVALRNVLSHLYDRVDLQIVWDTVVDELPVLIETLRNLLDSQVQDDSVS